MMDVYTRSLILGYTGTREGMSVLQHATTWLIVDGLRWNLVARHGDCVGGDAEFHAIARARGAYIVGHPPVLEYQRAFCACDELLPKKPFLERDRAIAFASQAMIAAPKTSAPTAGSGTWATIGHARELGLPLAIVMPDGTVVYERDFVELYA